MKSLSVANVKFEGTGRVVSRKETTAHITRNRDLYRHTFMM